MGKGHLVALRGGVGFWLQKIRSFGLRFQSACVGLFSRYLCSFGIAASLQLVGNCQEPDEDVESGTIRGVVAGRTLLEKYCLDCHNSSNREGDLDLDSLTGSGHFDGVLPFENVVTERMPPGDSLQPTTEERKQLLAWLAESTSHREIPDYRRLSRHELTHSINDLLGLELDFANEIPEDRGTYAFESDRRIRLSNEQLAATFRVVESMLEFAFPKQGYSQEWIWTTNAVKDSHETYNIYVRDYLKGLLFSWTRANNGNSYSYFYDHFEPTEAGWYDLTFDVSKVGAFPGDVSILVYAGKYYYADDRPQPQRMLGVLSVGNSDVQSMTVRGFLYPGENVSVHCYSPYTWRQQNGVAGAYIEKLQARGPLEPQWPPEAYRRNLEGVDFDIPDRVARRLEIGPTVLERIGGSVRVSSFQVGMEKEKMLDRSSKTFWHTRFTPDVATPPHFVVIENPRKERLAGLTYSTWTGGNGNGQLKSYSVFESDDGRAWSDPIAVGRLEVMHAAEQEIRFRHNTDKRFLQLRVDDAVSLDGKSLASIGGLDVILGNDSDGGVTAQPLRIGVRNADDEKMKRVIRRFAHRAFCAELREQDIEPYYRVALKTWKEQGDFLAGVCAGFKSVLCSHRFLLVSGVPRSASYRVVSDLARVLWLSVPDDELLELGEGGTFPGAGTSLEKELLDAQIDRMLKDPRGKRMVHSFCDQWLNLRGFNKISPSLKLYPEYNDLLNYYLPLETEEYLRHALIENLPVTSLIDSDFAVLNQRLAEHYGVEGVIGQELRIVALPAGSPRGGLLTMGSILKVTSDGFQTSPILRGAWVSKNIAGNTLSPPPANVKAIEPGVKMGATLKEQIAEHKNNAACYACHKSIDPYGFALEHFDATGRWRENYREELPHQGTFSYRLEGYFRTASGVDASGEIGDVAFQDIHGFKAALLRSHKKIAYNFAKKFFEYTNGYEPTLKQRLDLFAMIPDDPQKCLLRDLLRSVLAYSILHPIQGTNP